jgi:hypothetical protein
MEGKGSSIRGRERVKETRRQGEAKQSQIKIRNPNIEIRNKLKNLNTNYGIPKPFVWNFVFLIDAEAVSRFRSSLDSYAHTITYTVWM